MNINSMEKEFARLQESRAEVYAKFKQYIHIKNIFVIVYYRDFEDYINFPEEKVYATICAGYTKQFQEISHKIIQVEKNSVGNEKLTKIIRAVQELEKTHLELFVSAQVWKIKFSIERGEDYDPKYVEAMRDNRIQTNGCIYKINNLLAELQDLQEDI